VGNEAGDVLVVLDHKDDRTERGCAGSVPWFEEFGWLMHLAVRVPTSHYFTVKGLVNKLYWANVARMFLVC
jgi:hypothetical protein